MDTFESFVEKHNPEIMKVVQLLSEPLSKNPIEMMDQLRIIEASHCRIGIMLVHAKEFLDLAARDLLPKKEDGLTELDREIKLQAAIASQRRFRDGLEVIYNSIRTRVSSGQSLLSYLKREAMLVER